MRSERDQAIDDQVVRGVHNRATQSLIDDPRLAITLDEVAALLGVSRSTVYRSAARGDLPSVRVGRRLLVAKVPLLRLLGVEPAADQPEAGEGAAAEYSDGD